MSLTPRQWKLYDLLKQNTEQWLTQYEISQQLSDLYGKYTGDSKLFHDTTIRYDLTEDIRKINQSDVIQKIILSSSQGVKIANEEEYREWSYKKWRSIKGMIKRLVWKDNKAKLDGQMKLVFGDSVARNFYETFKPKEKVDLTNELDEQLTFIRDNANYNTWKLSLREVIKYLKDIGQYEEGMTKQEIIERFGDLYEAGAFI